MNLFLIIILLFVVLFIATWKFSTYFPCPSWIAWIVEIENPFAKENQSKQIIKRLQLKNDVVIADIGCGPGRVTIPVAQIVSKNSKVFAIDLQKEMLEKVKTKAQKNELSNITYIQAALGENKIGIDTFDIILLVNVLGEIPDQQQALQEIYNALKPNGIVSIVETIFDPHFQKQETVKKITQHTGLTIKETFGPWYSYNMILKKTVNKEQIQ